jgi:hypothetical protein
MSISEGSHDMTNTNPSWGNSHIDVRTLNPYVFVSHTYDGTGGYYDGSYLFPFARESFYEERKKTAFYRNFLKPIIKAITEPVFSKNVIRETSNPLFESFLNNVDNIGSKISANAYNVTTLSRLHGVTFVVMDNFTTINAMSVNEAINLRLFPYIYIQPAYTVSSHTTDDYGKLTSITFKHTELWNDDKECDVYVTWNDIQSIKVYSRNNKELTRQTNTHNLGVLPVISVYSDTVQDILPVPPVYDIAKLNYAIFNKDSELRDQERATAFSMLYMQTDSNNNNFAIGSHNILLLPASSDITIPPAYISPDTSIMSTLSANTEVLINSIFSAAQQQGVVAIKETSGIAEAYKFRAQSTQLQKTAIIAEHYEQKVAELFSRYIKQDVDYIVNYDKTYDPFYSRVTVDELTKLLSLPLPDDVKKALYKSIVSKTLDHLDQDTLNVLFDSIDKSNTTTV